MSYLQQLVQNNRDIWDAAVHHELMNAMNRETLSDEGFQEYVQQLAIVLMQGVRALLGKTMAVVLPEDQFSSEMMQHLQTLHPGGRMFDVLKANLSSLGMRNMSNLDPMPATEAICNYMFKIGTVGTVHEKVLALATITELLNQRYQVAWKENPNPRNRMFNQFMQDFQPVITDRKMQYLSQFLEATVKNGQVSRDTDTHVFRRILQWMMIIDSAAMHKGTLDWPSSLSSARTRNA
jgi:thiaminase